MGVNILRNSILSKRKAALLLLIIIIAAAVWLTGLDENLTLENLKKNRDLLHSYVKDNYVSSVVAFIAVVVSTAFFVPGATVITIVGGYLFGVTMGTVYLLVGATLGATLAFLSAQYLIGNWIQHRFQEPLKAFNKEVTRHGHNYLITFRMVPVMPFFLVNYLAGITKMPLGRFMWTTALGMFPGTVVYCFAGRELGDIESPDDIMSPRLMVALSLLALFAVLPVLIRLFKWFKGRMT